MTDDTKRTVDTLNGFLRGEISAVETYRQAISKLNHSAARAPLQECHGSHEQRIPRLRDEISRMGGVPANDSGAWGSFAKLVEGGAKAFGERAAIAALEEGEDHGLKLYRDDLDKLDPLARQWVERDLLPAQVRTHQAMSTLKHSFH
jgi:hypothetical protein